MSDKPDRPVIDLVPRPRATPRPIDDVARETYVAELKRTGSRVAAAAAARPHLRSARSAARVFHDYIANDPEFRARVEDAEANLAAKLEVAAIDRALNGMVEEVEYLLDEETGQPVLRDDGEPVVKYKKVKYDNKLLLSALRRVMRNIDPEAWREVKQVDVRQTNLDVSLDLDALLEEMPREQRQSLLVLARKQLSPGAGAPGPEPDPAHPYDHDDQEDEA